MVKPLRKGKSKVSFLTKVMIMIVVFVMISISSTLILQSDVTGSSALQEVVDQMDSTTHEAVDNTAVVSDAKVVEKPAQPSSSAVAVAVDTKANARIKSSRAAIKEKCVAGTPLATEDLQKQHFSTFPGPSDTIPERSPRLNIKLCKNVVLDFGANVGDTAGHLIDAGLPTCESNDKSDSHPRLMLGDRKLELGKWNMVTRFLKQMMDANKLYPEDYCYYGIEGNPVFTERLQGIEDYINAIDPSPLAHASFFTESVGAGEYGMTKLFLDTVNTKENFWGSSIMQGHQDVRKSMNEGNMTEAPHHDVMGYTITKLMEMTLLGLKKDATEDEKKGAHLLLKVDIEGGEYVLTQEVVESKALCKFVELGNTVDVVIETHSQRVTGPNPLMRKFGGWRKELEECGVTFRGLQAWWA